VERLKEKYAQFNQDGQSTQTTPIKQIPQMNNYFSLSFPSPSNSLTSSFSSSWSVISNFNNKLNSCFLHTSNCCEDSNGFELSNEESECDQANHLWFCLKDYSCSKMEEFIAKLKDYIQIRTNKSELILVHTAHPLFEYKDVLSEARRILALYLNKSTITKTIDELMNKKFPMVAREHIENLLNKYIYVNYLKKKII
jgi:hypothetical protein